MESKRVLERFGVRISAYPFWQQGARLRAGASSGLTSTRIPFILRRAVPAGRATPPCGGNRE